MGVESIFVPDHVMREWLEALIKKTWLGERHWYFQGYSADRKTTSFYTMLPPKGMWTIYGSATVGKVSSIFISWGDTPVDPETQLYKTFDKTETALSLLATELYVLARGSADKRLPDTLPLIHQAITE